MNTHTFPVLTASLALLGTTLVAGAGSSAHGAENLDQLVGQPVDISPWAYAWRANSDVQEKPEAYFIPRRLNRLDKVYRTAIHELSPQDLKSIYYDMPDLLKPLPPAPPGALLAGLLWEGKLSEYRVELHWPNESRELPSPEAVEVRAYPTSYGWFGWTVDQILDKPEISADGHTWTYRSKSGAKMDFAYSKQVDAATEMVAVFSRQISQLKGTRPLVPLIRVTSPSLGLWKRMDVEVEWGLGSGAGSTEVDGLVEARLGIVGEIASLSPDNGVTTGSERRFRSRPIGDGRRGIVVPMLYASSEKSPLDTRLTVWMAGKGFTISTRDLNHGPILIPEHHAFATKAGSGQTATLFIQDLAAKNLKSIRQMTREHPEARSWEEVMRQVRLSTCPEGTALAPFPKLPDPPMIVRLPDAGWENAWRAACRQLQGKHLWGGLAFEVGRVARDMELVGLHDEAAKVYAHFLESPGVKSDGDFSDGKGALEWATSMRHDMGYSHDGTHASTGRLLFAMAERYFLTGDKEWFSRNRARMQAAADWIIRQRTSYMKDTPGRDKLLVAGLMPPCMLGDYAIPSCDWHWYYFDNAFAVQGLAGFADALSEIDLESGRRYRTEAEAFRRDVRRAVEREAALSPVRLGRDGAYHTYIPRMAYALGMTGPEFGAPQYPDGDLFMGALPLGEPLSVLEAGDERMLSTIDVMEEMGTSVSAVEQLQDSRRKRDLSTDDAWFWNTFVSLPKASHNANVFLLQDDVPSFLRYWSNSYTSMVGSDGRLWEHWHLGQFTPCETPDNGTAGWFLENFRNLLVMESGDRLWVARATPRAWLGQGKRIAVQRAPTHFGTLNYEIISDADNGRITATMEIPSRRPTRSIVIRLRHPRATPIRSVQVNGKPWTDFNPEQETIELIGMTGQATVVARY